MRDELTRRGEKRYVNTGENSITGITFFDVRVLRRSNVNMKFLDVLYKSVRLLFF
jgi:hypothetical protein